jgi:hypothetical protein
MDHSIADRRGDLQLLVIKDAAHEITITITITMRMRMRIAKGEHETTEMRSAGCGFTAGEKGLYSGHPHP